ncbi:flagellin [Oceanobacillus sp. Castelsardo]|uniref:flagellin N-terminal helical domain-containing protein n=1 Tax=Oceanobacillus sp. Castelsardo TaxID=1851204 RepID=UPI0008388AA0|nr:flagellin [Oceanobacillus sp. Castelsardo]
MRINHNIAALNTYRQLGNANNAQQNAMEKLSSGLRINSAADDAAGLAISEKMRGQIRGLEQAQSNAQDGISLIQTAEGALNETHSILQRMRELSVQATNDTLNDSDRGEIQKEVDQLVEEIDRISSTTEFNTKKLLDGSMGAERTATAGVTEGQVNFKVSSDTAQVTGVSGVLANDKVGTHEITFSVGAAGEIKGTATDLDGTETLSELGITDIAGLKVGEEGSEVTLTGLDLNSTVADLVNAVNTQATGASAEIVEGQLVINSNSQTSGNQVSFEQDTASAGSAAAVLFGAGSSSVEANSTNADATALTVTDKYTDAGGNETTTVDRAGTYGDGSSNVSWNGATFTKGTGNISTATVTVEGLEAVDSKAARKDLSATLQIGANENQTMNVDIEDMSAQALGLVVGGEKISVSNSDDASRSITKINNAIETVSAERSKLGAFQNRLEHTINNLGTSSENLTASESRIRDVDYALAA